MNLLDKLVFLLSCAAHDLDHPGNNNLFEINSKSLLALTYNDKSVLENYHLFLLFNFLNNNSLNIFECDMHEMKIIRKSFISYIIATDMANHNGDLKKLHELIGNENFSPVKKDNKEFILSQLIHYADISNGSKPFKIYERWVNLLFEEFFHQGDKEKEMKLPVSMLCDRETVSIPDTQIFFIDNIALRLVKSLYLIFPKMQIFINSYESNREVWKVSKESKDKEKDKV